MKRCTRLTVAVMVTLPLLAACGKTDDTATDTTVPPTATTPMQETTTTPPPPTATEELPSVDNTEVDYNNPTDVAYHFVLMSTTFLPGDVFDPVAASERGYPLATERYRKEQAPVVDPKRPITRGWWNQDASEDDPTATVTSEVELLRRPTPVGEDETTAVREFRSTQTPVTTSGRRLPSRVQDAEIHLVKQDDGRWLVDQGLYEIVDD